MKLKLFAARQNSSCYGHHEVVYAPAMKPCILILIHENGMQRFPEEEYEISP